MQLWPFSSGQDKLAKSVAAQLEDMRKKLGIVLLRVRLIEAQNKDLRKLVGGLYRLLQTPRARITGEDRLMSNVMKFEVDLPPVKDTDTVSRSLKVTIGDQSQDYPLTTADTVVTGLSGPQDSSVKLELKDIDDAGNSADYPVVEFVLADTVPPAVEGAPSVRVTGEE